MNYSLMFGLLSLICALGSLYYGIRIALDLRSRGFNAHPAFIRWMIFSYIGMYKTATVKETGQIGPLYNPCVTYSTLALIFGAGTLLSLAM